MKTLAAIILTTLLSACAVAQTPYTKRQLRYQVTQDSIATHKFDLVGAQPIRFETRRPLMGTALPLAILSTISSVASFTRLTGDPNDNDKLFVLLGLASGVLATNWWIQALKTEQWVVYSNGTSMRVEFHP